MELDKNTEWYRNITRMFNAKSVAIVGVTREGFGFGSGILMSLLEIGYEGKIYPVNPKGGSLMGIDIYESVESIPGSIDLGIIAVPAHKVPEEVEACRAKGAAGVEILSAGFKELGTEEGIALEEKLKSISSNGIRIIGPNCFGIYCPESGLTMIPGPDLSREAGPVAFLSQSGGMSVELGSIGKWKGIRFSKMVSFGNGVDLRETELVRYLAMDDETKIISMYIEGIEDGAAFVDAVRDTALKKPVIVFKGGMSAAGKRAAESHTASIAGKKVIWESVINQCNAVQAEDIKELSDLSLAFSLLPPGDYNKVLVAGGGGALGVVAADMAEKYGLELPQLEKSIEERIMEVLPKPGSSAKNPLDIANPYVSPDVIKKALVTSAEDERIDIQILMQYLFHYKMLAMTMKSKSIKQVTPYRKIAEAVVEAKDISKKPIVMVLPNYKREIESLEIEEMIQETREILVSHGVPVFDELRDAINSISKVSLYYRRRERFL